MAQLKLYTEEQVKTMLNKARIFDGNVRENFVYILSDTDIILAEAPIELPSDVEVGKIVLGNSAIMEHRDSGYFAAGAMSYNKWLKEQILNK